MEKDQLIRFVLSPDNEVVPDIAEKLPGRGLWISANRGHVTQAVAKKLFSKAAKANAKADAALPDNVQTLLRTQALNLLGLARRAGEVTNGFEKTKAWLMQNEASVLLAACDGAMDGRKKLQTISRQTETSAEIVEIFSAAELSKTLGKEIVVHAAIKKGGLADRFKQACDRITSYEN